MAEEKKKRIREPKLALAILLCLLMLLAALLWGAHKGWQQELSQVQSGLGQVEERLQMRREAGSNILVVAARHLPQGDPMLRSLKADVATLGSKAGLAERAQAAARISSTSQELLGVLLKTPSLMADSRDSAYARQLLPQQIEQSAAQAWQAEYNLLADSYNKRLEGSFSGLLARLSGIKRAEVFEGELN